MKSELSIMQTHNVRYSIIFKRKTSLSEIEIENCCSQGLSIIIQMATSRHIGIESKHKRASTIVKC